MEENKDMQEGRTIAFEFEEGCRLSVDRTPGTNGCSVTFQATTATAALKGISLLTVKLAELTSRSVDEVLCRLAVVLLAQEGMPEDMEGAEYGTEEG